MKRSTGPELSQREQEEAVLDFLLVCFGGGGAVCFWFFDQ